MGIAERIAELRSDMLLAAENLEFEQAARLRDALVALERPPKARAREEPGRAKRRGR